MEDVIKPAITESLNGKSDRVDTEKQEEEITLSKTNKPAMTKTEIQQSLEPDQLAKSDDKSAESPSYATSDGGTDLFISNSEFSSNASTPVPPEPFSPKFKVCILPNDVTKDGDIIKYTISSQTLDAEVQEFSVLRTYEDFQWLHHSLSTGTNTSGIIIPPLPPKIQSAIEKSKKQLGNNAKTLLKDEFGKDCRKLQKYLTLLAKHHLFGQEETFQQFLTHKDTPVHTQVRKGFFNKFSDAVRNRKYGSESDCEEFFKIERESVEEKLGAMRSSNDSFMKMVSSQLRLCEVLNHLSTAVMLSISTNDNPISTNFNKLNNLFSKGLKDSKDALETLSVNDETTLGSFLELYSDYLDCEKEMLNGRTCLMIEYENANRALEKTKNNPVKHNNAVEHKKEAELNFEKCSDSARQEIKRFHRERIVEFQRSLTSYCEARLRNARDTYTLLTAAMAQLKHLKLPSDEEIKSSLSD